MFPIDFDYRAELQRITERRPKTKAQKFGNVVTCKISAGIVNEMGFWFRLEFRSPKQQSKRFSLNDFGVHERQVQRNTRTYTRAVCGWSIVKKKRFIFFIFEWIYVLIEQKSHEVKVNFVFCILISSLFAFDVLYCQ